MLTRLLWLGAAASTLVAASSWWVGAVPHSFQTRPPAFIDWLPVSGAVPRAAYYLGVGVLVLTWILLGRAVAARDTGSAGGADEVPRRSLYLIAGAWALPLLAATPIGSRDLWAYAAQGNLDRHGLDPYTHSPADLPGIFADNVSDRWVGATTPYGPLWLLIGRLLAHVGGSHVQLTVFLLRLPILLGYLLVLWALVRLAPRLGARADTAVWLAVLNPLTLILGVGGGHNDLLMTGLMVAGVLVAVRPGGLARSLVPAAALMAGAAAIKSPAAIGVAFVVPFWLHYQPPDDLSRRVRMAVLATGAALISSLATFAVITVAGGHGLGWMKQVNSSAPVVNWMSLPTTAAMLARISDGTSAGATTLDSAMQHWRTGGLILAAVVIAAFWVISTARETRRRAAPLETVGWFTAALLLIVVLGPAVQPWYFGWALPFGALLPIGRRTVSVLITLSVWLVLMIRPIGTGLQMEPALPAVLAVSIVVGGLAVRGWPTSTPATDRERVELRRRS